MFVRKMTLALLLMLSAAAAYAHNKWIKTNINLIRVGDAVHERRHPYNRLDQDRTANPNISVIIRVNTLTTAIFHTAAMALRWYRQCC